MFKRLQGVLLMVAATAAFTVMIALVKQSAAEGYQVWDIIAWRSWVAIPMVWLLVGRRLVVARWDLLLARCAFGTAAMFCFFTAAHSLPIGELSVLVKLQPALVAMFAPLVLGKKERPERSVIVAIVFGLLGTLFLLWPKMGGLQFTGALWGIGAAICSTVAHTSLRALGPTDDTKIIVFWFQVFVGLCALMMLSTSPVPELGHFPITALQGGIAVAIGGFAALGQLLMSRAYQLEQASKVAAASYSAPLFGYVADLLVFQTLPTLWGLLGMASMLGGGYFLVSRPTALEPKAVDEYSGAVPEPRQ